MAKNNISSKCIGMCLALSVCLTAPAKGLQLMKLRAHHHDAGVPYATRCEERVEFLRTEKSFNEQRDMVTSVPNLPNEDQFTPSQKEYFLQHVMSPGIVDFALDGAYQQMFGTLPPHDWLETHPLMPKTQILPNLWLGAGEENYANDQVNLPNGEGAAAFLNDLYFFPVTKESNLSQGLKDIPSDGDAPRKFSMKSSTDGETADIGVEQMQGENHDMAKFKQALRVMNILLFQKNKRVFVACQQGKDRSAALVVAFVAVKYKITVKQAEIFVRAQRPLVTVGEVDDAGKSYKYWGEFLMHADYFNGDNILAGSVIADLHAQFAADLETADHAGLHAMVAGDADVEGEDADAEDADSNRDNVDTEEGGCMACCRSN